MENKHPIFREVEFKTQREIHEQQHLQIQQARENLDRKLSIIHDKAKRLFV